MPQVRVDDTLEMEYRIDDFTDPWKRPDTIVMLTGCNKPKDLFYSWIPTLARHFKVVRPYLRGHWESTPAPQGYQWTFDGLISDLVNFLDALDLKRVHWVGEALGGVLGYHLAYRYPERIITLTTCNCPGPSFKNHRMSVRGVERLLPRPSGGGVISSSEADRIAEMGPENSALANWVNSSIKKGSLEAAKGYMTALSGCEVNPDEFLPKLQVPTLLLIGAEHTRIVSVPEQQHYQRLIPRAELVAFPGVKGECEYLVPDKCAAEVLRFIRTQTGYKI